MLKGIRHLILSTSLLILLGHGWMPHGHGPAQQTAHFTALGCHGGLLPFIGALLAHDGGYDHLEDYAPGMSAFLPSLLPPQPPLFEPPPSALAAGNDTPPPCGHIPLSGLRSPPRAV